MKIDTKNMIIKYKSRGIAILNTSHGRATMYSPFIENITMTVKSSPIKAVGLSRRMNLPSYHSFPLHLMKLNRVAGMGEVEARLLRLISSEICQADNAKQHAVELRRLADSVGDEDSLRLKEKFFKALGDAIRLRIIKMLAAKEMCVCEIMVVLDLSQPNASHHLNILEREGIVRRRREGRWILYRLSRPEVTGLIDGAGK